MRYWRGYTIIEMAVTVALLGVMLAIAVPSFREMLDRNHLATASNDLISAFLTTRSEAVKRECRVSISRNGAWNTGWTTNVLTDIAGCTALQLISHETSGSGLGMAIATSGNIGNAVIFSPDGRAVGLAAGSANFFTLTLNGQTRTVCLTQNGRAYVQEGGACS